MQQLVTWSHADELIIAARNLLKLRNTPNLKQQD